MRSGRDCPTHTPRRIPSGCTPHSLCVLRSCTTWRVWTPFQPSGRPAVQPSSRPAGRPSQCQMLYLSTCGRGCPALVGDASRRSVCCNEATPKHPLDVFHPHGKRSPNARPRPATLGLAELVLEVGSEAPRGVVVRLYDGKVLRGDLAALVEDAGAVFPEPCPLRATVLGFPSVTTVSFAAATGLSVPLRNLHICNQIQLHTQAHFCREARNPILQFKRCPRSPVQHWGGCSTDTPLPLFAAKNDPPY